LRDDYRVGFSDKRLLIGVLILAATLRFVGANSEFWFDEIATVIGYVRLPASQIIRSYEAANNHVLNSLLAHAAASIWGEQPWAVRLPSILFGVAGVWAFHFLASQLWSGRVALPGTFMFAVSYHHIYYTQNARGYSGFLFFALLATGLLLRELRRSPSDVAGSRSAAARGFGAAYACSLGLGMYAMILMIFVIMGHGVVLLLSRRWRLLGWLLAGVAFALLLYLPMAEDVITYYSNQPTETGHSLLSAEFLQELKPAIPLLIAASIVAPLLLWRLARRHSVAAALIVLPLVFNIVVPALRGQGVHPRSLIYGLPVAYFFLMEAMEWASARRHLDHAAWIGVLAVTIVSIAMLSRYYPLPKQGFRQALQYVAARRAPMDEQMGLTLGGKAARFYDPSVILIETSHELQEWLKTADAQTWVIYSFPGEMRQSAPELYHWLATATASKASFRGVIGDGDVHVHLWQPQSSAKTSIGQ